MFFRTSFTFALMMTGAFSRNVGKLFSELKLVTDNLLSIHVYSLFYLGSCSPLSAHLFDWYCRSQAWSCSVKNWHTRYRIHSWVYLNWSHIVCRDKRHYACTHTHTHTHMQHIYTHIHNHLLTGHTHIMHVHLHTYKWICAPHLHI